MITFSVSFLLSFNFALFQTPAEYTSQLWEHFSLREDEFQNYTMIPQASYGYDAIWAVALALNRSVEVLKAKVFSNGQQRRLEQFSHGDNEMFDVIFDALGSVDFEGVSVKISWLFYPYTVWNSVCENTKTEITSW